MWNGDLVIVGGGIAGAALAAVLARDGYDILLLERETRPVDRVRGEVYVAWGCKEMLSLGLEQVLVAGGGSYLTSAVLYDEIFPPGGASAPVASLVDLIPGVAGHFTMGHPDACETLIRDAERHSATVRRGVREVDVVAGESPRVRYRVSDAVQTAACRLVVGADGRKSQLRRAARIPMKETEPATVGGGMLVQTPDTWPAELCAVGTEDDVHFQVFPRKEGCTRLYLYHDAVQKRRFKGSQRVDNFLRAFQRRSFPATQSFHRARPAGPCIFYPMTSSWTECPVVEGMVLVGDAAGWSDPILGQGLSVALRDARMVAEAVRGERRWSARIFQHYTRERAERMRRLRIASWLRTQIHCTFTTAGVQRRRKWYEVWNDDPTLGGVELGVLVGPEAVPEESFSEANLARIMALR